MRPCGSYQGPRCLKQFLPLETQPYQSVKTLFLSLFSYKNATQSSQTGVFWPECGHCPANHTLFLRMYCTQVVGVQHIIKDVLRSDVDFTCVFFMGNIDQKLSKSDRYLIKIFMTEIKKAITKHWLSKETPSVKQCIAIVQKTYTMERLTSKR